MTRKKMEIETHIKEKGRKDVEFDIYLTDEFFNEIDYEKRILEKIEKSENVSEKTKSNIEIQTQHPGWPDLFHLL